MKNNFLKRILLSILITFSLILGVIPQTNSNILTAEAYVPASVNVQQDDYSSYTWSYYKGVWYLYDYYGTCYTGWFWDGYNTYYLDEDTGAMLTGWLYYYGDWYYFNDDGSMHTGWFYDGYNFYHFNQFGEMETGWIYDGYSWYYLYPNSGIMAANTYISGYYLNTYGEWVY